MVKAFIAFIAVKYQFQKPAVFITLICRLWFQVLIGFKNDYTENSLLF